MICVGHATNILSCFYSYILSHGYSLYIFAHLWWFGVLELGPWIGLLGLMFSVDGVWGLLGFLGWGSVYKHERITLAKTMEHF